MRIHILFILLSIINIMNTSSTKNWHNRLNMDRINFDRTTLERASFRYVIFKEKTLKKFIKNMKNTIDIYHNKSIVSIAEGVISYNELSEDEKTLVEVVISLCY